MAWLEHHLQNYAGTVIAVTHDRYFLDNPPGGIIGIIGPNGAGKTTLFRMITGQEKPDSKKYWMRERKG